ncbi:GAF domain-containing protein [Asaia bogorensis]|uniref:GAF domain-containing protein n=1 Tax=Asaia bogorensis TaxID=91915 RepID=UPI00164AC112|nr:GAF domain-containing protein [Asaia bogorensis]
MTTRPFPSALLDDEQRLTLLDSYGILDTSPDPAFDDLAAAAAACCQVPIALISFVDRDRQWFKATFGTDLKETPIDQSVCGYVVEACACVVIPDLAQDARTRDNPLVTGPPNLRFYGGTPLLTAEGAVLGSLAVLDITPRAGGLQTHERTCLETLARHVMRLLELHRDAVGYAGDLAQQRNLSAAALRRARRAEVARQHIADSHASQETAGAAGGIGTFELDLHTNQLSASPEMCRILGLPVQELEFGDWVSVIQPDDLRDLPSPEGGRNDDAPSSLTYRILRPSDDAVRWVLRRARFECNDSGRTARMIGTLQDITTEKDATARLDALIKLGDQLRDATNRQDALATACATLGTLLYVDRVGFAQIDMQRETYTIEHVWCAEGIAPIEGVFSFDAFPRITGFLRDGVLCAISDLTTTAWLAAERDAHRAIGIAAQMLVPVTTGKTLMGALFVHSARPRDWTLEETSVIQAAADRIFVTLGMLDAQARQAIINHEILHRMKNTLAVVQALASQGLRQVQDRKAVASFTQRLIALSTAHDALMRRSWLSTDLLDLTVDVCTKVSHAERFSFEGAPVQLGPDTATTMAMVFHELATNAVKYGALSTPQGKVAVRWTVEGKGDQRGLVLTWIESGGPTVHPPKRRGFGLRILENGLGRQSQMELSYKPEGLHVTLCASIASIVGT